MRKALLICIAGAIAFTVQGCHAGEVSSQQQKDKADALQRYVEQHKNDGPPRQERPN